MRSLLHRLKKRFDHMTVREQMLTLIFIIVILFIWASSTFKRGRAWNAGRQQAHSELEVQRQYLQRADEYDRAFNQALQRVEPEKTYQAAQLAGKIDNILRQSGLSGSADMDPAQTQEGEIFDDHDIRVRLKRISIAQLIQFNQLLKQEVPYITLQNVRIDKNKRKPEELNVRLKINSFYLKLKKLETDSM